MTKNVYIHDYKDHLRDRLEQETVGTIETETRKMSGVKHLFSKNIWFVMRISPQPSIRMVKVEPKHLATVPCLEIFIED